MRFETFFGDGPKLEQIRAQRYWTALEQDVKSPAALDPLDNACWHIAALDDFGWVIGAVRMFGNQIGAWFVLPQYRKTRVAGMLIREVVRLADTLGIRTAFATATERNGSAAMLLSLGAKIICRNHSTSLGCELQALVFHMDEIPQRFRNLPPRGRSIPERYTP